MDGDNNGKIDFYKTIIELIKSELPSTSLSVITSIRISSKMVASDVVVVVVVVVVVKVVVVVVVVEVMVVVLAFFVENIESNRSLQNTASSYT